MSDQNPNKAKPAQPSKPKQEEEVYVCRRKVMPPVKIFPPLMPLIDVMFTLMMFFLVAAKIRQPEGLIPANLPKITAAAAQSTVLESVRLSLYATGDDNTGLKIEQTGNGELVAEFTPDKDRKVNAQHQEVMVQALAQFLRRRYDPASSETPQPVTITPLGNVRWEHVVNVFNQAVKAKYKEIGLASR
jgi:biopolymer transport protein ExbD